MQTLTFDSILDDLETLSVDEQTNLLAIMHRRRERSPSHRNCR
ncbi:hypothetical protein QUB63_20975 [Microcoleus sp. ARI1-B5]